MNNELKEKLQSMTKEELNQILESEYLYVAETVEFVKQLLNDNVEEKTSEAAEENCECANDKDNDNKSIKSNEKISTGVVAVIICALICLTVVITVFYVANQNNKKMAVENATIRINKLVEEIYLIDDCYGKEYLLAQDKLIEIKAIIDENDIDGLPLTKYNEASAYLNDLKNLDDIYTLSQKNYDSRTYVKEAGRLIGKLKDKKVKNKISSQGDILVGLAENVKKVLVGKALYAAQQYFEKTYTNSVALCVGEFRPGIYISDYYTTIKANYANEISVNGFNGLAISENEAIDYTDIDTEMLASSVKEIQSKGGYAIFVNYYNNDDNFVLYPPTRTLWWNVGVDVSADLVGGEIKYTVTKYNNGIPQVESGLSVDEALNFTVLNPK